MIMSLSSRSIFLVLIIGLCAIADIFPEVVGEKDSHSEDIINCIIDFTDSGEIQKVWDDCAKKHKPIVDQSKLDSFEAYLKQLKAKDFDDDCLAKCFYEGAGLLEKDGKIKAAAFDSYYKKSNVTEELKKEIVLIAEDCVKETEAQFKDAKELPCKMYVINDLCMLSKSLERKKKLEEFCNKKSK